MCTQRRVCLCTFVVVKENYAKAILFVKICSIKCYFSFTQYVCHIQCTYSVLNTNTYIYVIFVCFFALNLSCVMLPIVPRMDFRPFSTICSRLTSPRCALHRLCGQRCAYVTEEMNENVTEEMID